MEWAKKDKDVMKKLLFNLLHSIRGLSLALHQFSFKLEILWGFIFVGVLTQINAQSIEKLLGVILISFLLAFEMMNTSIEMLGNKITVKHDLDIKNIKDVASGGVFLIFIMNIYYLIYLLSVNGLHSGSFLKKLIG